MHLRIWVKINTSKKGTILKYWNNLTIKFDSYMALRNVWTVTKSPNDIFKIVVMSKHKIKKSNAASANHTFPYFDTRYFKRGTSVKFTMKSLFLCSWPSKTNHPFDKAKSCQIEGKNKPLKTQVLKTNEP